MVTLVDVWCIVVSGGDGSVSIYWYLTKEEASRAYQEEDEPFCDEEPRRVETYEGSNIHKIAMGGL